MAATLTEAFRVLRKNGFVARQNFLCCQSCACAQLNSEDKCKGMKAVYYTAQDGADLRPPRARRTFGGTYRSGSWKPEVMLAYGVVGSDSDEETVRAGQEAVEILKAQGLTVEWDGTANKRLLVSGFAV